MVRMVNAAWRVRRWVSLATALFFYALPPPIPRLNQVGKYWKFNWVVSNFGIWYPFQQETLRRFLHLGPCGREFCSG